MSKGLIIFLSILAVVCIVGAVMLNSYNNKKLQEIKQSDCISLYTGRSGDIYGKVLSVDDNYLTIKVKKQTGFFSGTMHSVNQSFCN
jgi:preprotein translocase subunit YajC